MNIKLIIAFLCIACVSCFASSGVDFSASEIEVINKIKKDISIMEFEMKKISEYISDPKGVGMAESLNVSLDVMKQLIPTQIDYYSSSLPKKNLFNECLVISLYGDIEIYSKRLKEYQECLSVNCQKSDRLKKLILLSEDDIQGQIKSCSVELSLIE